MIYRSQNYVVGIEIGIPVQVKCLEIADGIFSGDPELSLFCYCFLWKVFVDVYILLFHYLDNSFLAVDTGVCASWISKKHVLIFLIIKHI